MLVILEIIIKGILKQTRLGFLQEDKVKKKYLTVKDTKICEKYEKV